MSLTPEAENATSDANKMDVQSGTEQSISEGIDTSQKRRETHCSGPYGGNLNVNPSTGEMSNTVAVDAKESVVTYVATKTGSKNRVEEVRKPQGDVGSKGSSCTPAVSIHGDPNSSFPPQQNIIASDSISVTVEISVPKEDHPAPNTSKLAAETQVYSASNLPISIMTLHEQGHEGTCIAPGGPSDGSAACLIVDKPPMAHNLLTANLERMKTQGNFYHPKYPETYFNNDPSVPSFSLRECFDDRGVYIQDKRKWRPIEEPFTTAQPHIQDRLNVLKNKPNPLCVKDNSTRRPLQNMNVQARDKEVYCHQPKMEPGSLFNGKENNTKVVGNSNVVDLETPTILNPIKIKTNQSLSTPHSPDVVFGRERRSNS